MFFVKLIYNIFIMNIINNQMNSICYTCSEEIATNSDTVKYKCGHIFHRSCLLPKKMSILNPMCKKCDNGMLDGYPTSCDEADDDDDVEADDDDDVEADDDDDVEADDDDDVEADDDDDYYEDEDDEELTKYENSVVWQLSILTVSLIGFIISILVAKLIH